MAFKECRTAEADLGMLYYLSEADGTGGRLKARPEDFVVEEVSAGPDPKEGGRYTIAKVTARNWETNRMVRMLSRQMGISRDRIGFAGTKDKRAVTTQLMSFMCPPSQLEKVSLQDLWIEIAYTAGRGMSIGDLTGNRFTIRVTECEADPGRIGETLESVSADIGRAGGFPNYFGVQRFGVMRPITHRVGELLVRGDIEGAVRCYVCTPSKEESRDGEAAVMRAKLAESSDWPSLLKDMPKSMGFEASIVSYLAENPGDWVGAIGALPRNLQMMLVHAYQSYLFNLMLSERIRRGLPLNRALVGDVVVPRSTDGSPNHGDQVLVTDRNVDLVNRQIVAGKAFVTVVLYGSKSAFAEGEPGEVERGVVGRAGVEGRDFIIPGLPHCSSEGDRREVLCPVGNLAYHVGENGYDVSFSLPKGNYATCLMREFMKSEMTDYRGLRRTARGNQSMGFWLALVEQAILSYEQRTPPP